MVAVVSGSGLGLFGSTNAAGNAALGRGRDQIFVNSSTGNLVIQSQHEQLVALGLDVSLTSTYNSQGLMDDDNGDNWRLGVHQRLHGLTGTRNTAGSTITRTSGDGHDAVYRYEAGRYLSTEGAGAHDTLSYNAGRWTWTEGSSQVTETYNEAGQLTQSRDANGNTVSYGYDGSGLLTQITDASGQSTYLDYTGTDLTRIRVVSNGLTQTLTNYSYDGLHRLRQVKVDLSPQDNSIADSQVFITTYDYDGNSRRITSIMQGGSRIGFTYEQAPSGSYRLRSYTEGDDPRNTTTLSYTEASGGTSGASNVLQPFIPRTNLSAIEGQWLYYSIEVPAGSSALSVTTDQGSGDASLFVRRGAPPTQSAFDAASSASAGVDKRIHLESPVAGLWYVGVYAEGDFSGVRLDARPQTGTQVQQLLAPGIPATDLSGANQSTRHFRFEVPQGVNDFRVQLFGSNGAADLYLAANQPIDMVNPDYVTEGEIPELTISMPLPGTWYLAVRSEASYSNASLMLQFNVGGELPIVTAGLSREVSAGSSVALTAVGSDLDDGAVSYLWTQIGGPAVALSNAGSAQASFVAPQVAGPTLLTFRVQVTDGDDLVNADVVRVLVNTSAAASQPAVTRIRDGLGNQVTYTHDAQGRLARIENALGQHTEYAYDGAGNLTQLIEDASGTARVTAFQYDAHGNLTLSRDAAGRTVRRTYDARQQLLSETRYRVADSDAAGPGQAAQPLTERYVYGVNDRLRFTVSAEGRVSEFEYGSTGLRTVSRTYAAELYPVAGLVPEASLSEAQLVQWASTRRGSTNQLVEFAYDFRGALSRTTTYAATNANGVGIAASASHTQFVYDQRGELLQSIDARGVAQSADGSNVQLPYATTYVRDGLGRVTSTTQWIAAGNTRTNTTQYDDPGNRMITRFANGEVNTSVYDRSGRVLSTSEAVGSSVFGTTTYFYDAAGQLRRVVGPTGIAQHLLYDADGRSVGEVDGDGTLTEFVFDAVDQQVKTIRYADALPPAALATLTDASGRPQEVSLTTLKAALPTNVGRASDQITRTVYGAAGEVLYRIDALGAVTQLIYDGVGRLTGEIRHTTPVSIAREVDRLQASDVAVVASAEDRRARNFYDNDGLLLGTLDAEGALTENFYDAAGQLTRQKTYANPTAVNLRSTGSLNELRPAADEETTLDTERDAITYFYYDGTGRQIGVLDAELYLSETFYDVDGNVLELRRYDRVLTADPGNLQALQVAVAGAVSRSTFFVYDGDGKLTQQTNPEGTLTTYSYNTAGRLIGTTVAAGTTEARTSLARYTLGRVTQELSAEGAALLTAGLSQAQIDVIWERYGTRYEYDAAGLRISAMARPSDTETTKTLYFFDADDRLRFTVNALGEVQENRYNALGQQVETLAHTGRIVTEGLNGGLVTSLLTDRVSAIANAASDARTRFTYTLTGQLASTVSAAGASTTLSYDAFGDTRSSVQQVDASRALRTEFSYDKRGLLTRSQADPTGLNLSTQRSCDAFGREISVTDARGNVTRTQYDRVGQVILTRAPGGAERLTTYDAFARIRTTRDALGNVTVYSYNDATRSTTLTTPEGIAVTTVLNRHGQTLTVTAAGNTTHYAYDANGQVKTISDSLGTLEMRSYDRTGRQVTATDARGTVTRLKYDAANRVLSRSVDDNGLALTTSYAYGGQGLVIGVTEPGNLVTTSTYDADGRVTQSAIDPDGLNLRTTYEYAADGNVIKVTEGAGSAKPEVTQYVYDVLGRRTHEILDPGPGKLNITSTFKYDVNGNVTRKVDPRGFSTWYVYDANDRLIRSIDATGALTQNNYDLEGQLIASRQYATAVSTTTLASFGDVISALTVTASAKDRLTQSLFDRDGREVFSIGASGAVIERTFDANGNVTGTRQYAKSVAAGDYTAISALRAALTAAGNNLTTPAAEDRFGWSAYNLRGESVFTVDAVGAVARLERDAGGNVISTTAFATARTVTLPMDLASLTAWANQAAVANHADNRTTCVWYDPAGRQVFRLDAENALTETRYLDAERKTTTILYRDRVTLTAGATLAQVRANAVVASFSASRDRVSSSETDAARRVVRVYDALSSTTASSYEQYLYDSVGNRTTTIGARGSELAERNSDWARTERMRLGFPSDASLLTEPLREALRARYTTVRTFDAAGRELTSTDPLGGVTRKSYDALGNLVTLTDARGFKGYTYYDSAGRIQLQIDPLRFVTELRYDVFGNTEEIAYVNALSGTYDETTSITSLLGRIGTSANDRKLARTFDTRGLVETITYFNSPSNYTEQFQYDTFGQKTRFKDRNNAVFNYEYTARGELRKEISPQVEVVTQVLPTLVTQQLRLETVSDYNAFGERIALTEAAGTAQQRITRYSYDRAGHEVRIEAPSFNVYDRTTDTTTLTLPVTQQFYDTAGNLIRQIDPNGGVTVNYYDSRNLLVATVSPDGVMSQFEHDAVGNETLSRLYGTRLGTVDPNVRPTPVDPEDYRELKQFYDANNRRIATVTRNETLYSFARAVPTEVSSSGYYNDAVVTLARYDANGSVVETIDGNANKTRFYYDGVGNRTLQVDAARYVTHFEYNAQGQVIRERRLAGQLSQSFFDSLTPGSTAASILAAVPAGEDRITEFSFDALGRQTAERKLAVTYSALDTNGKPIAVTADVVTRAEYDGNGNLLAQVRADGGRFDFTYDALNRKISARDPQFDAFVAPGQALTSLRSEQQFKYDAHGNEVQQRSLGSTTAEDRLVAQQFDAAGNLRLRREADGATFSYEYDVSGNTLRTQRSVRDVNGVTHEYRTYARFDLLNQEVRRQDVEDEGTDTQVIRETQDTRYNGYGGIEAKGINGQFQEIYKYDHLGRLFFTNKETGTPRLYVYDANGNAVIEVQALQTDLTQLQGPAGVALLTPLEAQFTLNLYDQRNQLIEVFQPPMMFDELLAAPPSLPPGTGTQGNAAENLANLGQFTPTGFSNPVGGSQPYTTPPPRNLSSTTSPAATGFGPPPSGSVDTAENLAAYTLAQLGISTVPVDTTGPVVKISDLLSMNDTVRTVIETQTRVQTRTTTANVVNPATGAIDAIDVTVTTTNDVLTLTTKFTRSMMQVRTDGDQESLTMQWVATSDPNVITERTVTTRTERVTVVRNVTTTGSYVYGGSSGTASFTPSQSVRATVSKIQVNARPVPRIEYRVNAQVPSFPVLGSGPIRVTVTYPAGSTFQDSYGNENLSFILGSKYPSTVRYEKAGQVLAVIDVFNDVDDSPPGSIDYFGSIPGFVTFQGLPAGTDSVTFRMLGGAGAGDYQATAVTGPGGLREFQILAPYFATGQEFEFWAYQSGAIVDHGKGTLGTAAYRREHSFTTTTKSTENYEVRTNTANTSQASNPVPTNQSQNNYIQNLIRVLVSGEHKKNIIHRTQAYDAFGEVISQTDGRGKTTELFYNKLGNVIREVQPETLIYPEVGGAFTGRPITHNYFNQLGEQIGIQDANSSALFPGAPFYNTRVLVNGRVVKEYDVAGNVTQYTYDRLGNQRQRIDALNQQTAYAYDAAGRLLEQVRYEVGGMQHSNDRYEYDAAGNRSAHINALGDRETYLYDGQNRIRLYTSFEGRQTRYDYTYLSALAGIGGYEKVTTTAGITGLDTQIDRHDYFDKIRYHKDLGGHEFTYTYNHAGLLSGQTGGTATALHPGQDIRYTYYLNGLIRYIDDVGIDTHAEFNYDENGNRVGEYLSKNVLVAGSQNVQPYQVAQVEYDELNRVRRAWEDGRFEITYTYDAVGNRRSVLSKYFDLLTNRNQIQEFYYKYDKLNRFTVTLGQRDGSGEIVRGNTGYEVEYDVLGRRKSVISEFPEEGTNVRKYVKETYTYDRLDRVRDVNIINKDAQGALVHVGGTHRLNSVVGSLREYTVYNKQGSTETATSHVDYTYDRDQLVKKEITTTANNTSRRDRTLYNYDGDGILTSTVVNTINANGDVIEPANMVNTTYAYEKWDDYKQSTVTVVVGSANMRSWRMGTSIYRYDANGHISELVDSQANRTIRYINDANGQVLKRYQIDREMNGSDKPAVVRNFYYLNGRGIGDTGNDKVERRVDYAQQLAEQEKADKKGRTSQVNPQLDKRISPVTSSDFDQNFQPINDSFPARTATVHIVQANETLQSIALSMYGDSQYWYVIADANGLTGNDQLVFGFRLTVPNIVANTRNNADTFRPYDVEAALGKTDPTLPPPPPPPKGKGCGAVATILVVAVAIVATVFTAGAAASALATAAGGGVTGGVFAAGTAALTGSLAVTGVSAAAATAIGIGAAVIGGALGSAISQGVAIAAGLQKGFDFKGVALAAIGAGVTAGIGAALGGSSKVVEAISKFAKGNPYTFAALNGAASRALTQGIAVATNLQKSFSWKQVAVSAIAAPVARYVGGRAASLANNVGLPSAGAFADRFASNVGGALVRKVSGSRVKTDTLVAEAIGTAAGEAIVEGLQGIGQRAIQEVAKASSSQDAIPEAKIVATRLDGSSDTETALQTSRPLIGGDKRLLFASNDPASILDALGGTTTSSTTPGLAETKPAPAAGTISGVLEEVVTTAPRELALGDLIDTLAQVANGPRTRVSAGVRLFDADAIKSALGSYSGRIRRGSAFAASELLKSSLQATEAFNTGDAQLIALFPEGTSSRAKLYNSIVAAGGYFTEEVGLNLLEQINSGASGIDLTFVRGQSELYLDGLVSSLGIYSQTVASLTRSAREIGAESIERAVEFQVNALRSDDRLLPPRLTITEAGVQRSVDKAVRLAALAGLVGDLPGLIVAARGLLIPQGFSRTQFREFSSAVKTLVSQEQLPQGRILVQGSRVRRTAVPGKDIDVLYVMSAKDFEAFVAKRVSEVSAGTAKKILEQVRKNGKVNARGISRTFESRTYDIVQPVLPKDVSKLQFSIAREGSSFYIPPFIPIK